MRRNTRKNDRTVFRGHIVVAWEDPASGSHYATARCVDICDRGVSLQLHQSIPARAYVSFRIDNLKLAGRATVRHCAKRGAYFRIGLEFSGGLVVNMSVLTPVCS